MEFHGDKAPCSIPSTNEKNYCTARIAKRLCVPRSVAYFLLTMESTPFCLKCTNQPGVTVHTYTLDTKFKLKAILGSTMNSRPAWPTKEDVVTREEREVFQAGE